MYKPFRLLHHDPIMHHSLSLASAFLGAIAGFAHTQHADRLFDMQQISDEMTHSNLTFYLPLLLWGLMMTGFTMTKSYEKDRFKMGMFLCWTFLIGGAIGFGWGTLNETFHDKMMEP